MAEVVAVVAVAEDVVVLAATDTAGQALREFHSEYI